MLTWKRAAAAALTEIGLLVPLMPVEASATSTVMLPAVFKMALNDAVPDVSVALDGRTACGSLLVSWTARL